MQSGLLLFHVQRKFVDNFKSSRANGVVVIIIIVVVTGLLLLLSAVISAKTTVVRSVKQIDVTGRSVVRNGESRSEQKRDASYANQ